MIKRALISVTDKTGVVEFARALAPSMQLIASGGTAKLLQEAAIPITSLSDYTGFPECFGGRVKTLHPKIMGGILYHRGKDDEEAKNLGIEPIDLVICNLYDFAQAAKSDLPVEQMIEQMDIGGSTLIRSACKNFTHVAIVVDPSDYPAVLEELASNQLSLETRRRLAVKALNASADYEALLAQELSQRLGRQKSVRLCLTGGSHLRYGENPDQQAWVYSFPHTQGVAKADVLSGKELSYNNYEDATVAVHAVQALILQNAKHSVAIVKHGNLCGYATGSTLEEAFCAAWSGDTKSAFGSVIALTSAVGPEFIPLLKNKFIELLIAPQFDNEFVAWIKEHKPNLRLLQLDMNDHNALLYKSISGGMLVQTKKERLLPALEKLFQRCDVSIPKKVGVVTKKEPPKNQEGLFAFAIAAVNFAKSNAIAIVREPSPGCYQLLGIGSGQPNRVDSLQRLALPKAIDNLLSEHADDKNYDPKSDLGHCVLASDGFFPFDDSIHFAAQKGIKSCIQPGGSTNDQSVIDAANKYDLCMIFTGERYFTH